jgi:asparagine synthase (glutamine-hydrolysing)
VCGLAGFVERTRAPAQLTPMLAQIAHRGPDGEGQWTGVFGEWFVALGHRRLAILDLAGGAQPMCTPDGLACIVYNGELYNFPELRHSLEGTDWFRTRSDTEVLLNHVKRHWTKRLSALNGMFAFALWDQRSGRLLLARDRVGIKPLYYANLPGGGLVFASELAALLKHPRAPRRLSTSGLVSFFFSDYAHAPDTLVEGVNKLEPGHYLEWQGGVTSAPSSFWTLPESVVKPSESPSTLSRSLWSTLGQAVERQLVADVPVGVFLSGGIDSSVVATLAQQRSTQPLETFSISFDDPTFDESNYARLLAKRIGSRHVEQRLSEETLLDVMDDALHCLDEPLADPSFLPTFLVSRLAAKSVKVVLGGDGGDEVFGGYPTYQAHSYAWAYALLPASVRDHTLPELVSRLPARDSYHSLEWKLKRFILRWDDDPAKRHLRWMSSLDLPQLASAMPNLRHLQPSTLSSTALQPGDALNAMLALDFRTYLPGSVLTKVDRASMAHGLEVRPPLLDNDVVDLMFRLPSSVKIHHSRTKYLLKLAARGHVPEPIITRPKKGFAIPLARWLRGPLWDKLEVMTKSSPLWEEKLVDRRIVIDWVQLHKDRRSDYSRPLWALLVLDDWLRRENIALPKTTDSLATRLGPDNGPRLPVSLPAREP